MSLYRDADGYGPEHLVEDGYVSRETSLKLERFVALFVKWAGRINLVSAGDKAHIWQRHIKDSLILAKHIPTKARIIDLGSGGGFPGLVLAMLVQKPGHVTLIDASQKKAAFLKTIIRELDLPADVFADRIESTSQRKNSFDIVTARALAPLHQLCDYASPWLTEGAEAYFLKGKTYREEIAEMKLTKSYHVDVIHGESEDGIILKVSGDAT